MAAFILLLSGVAAISQLHPDMETLVYQSIDLDKYNAVTCKRPTAKEFVYLWSNSASQCLKEDNHDFVFSSYVAYLEARRIDISREFNHVWMNYKKRGWGSDTFEAVGGEGSNPYGAISHFIYDNLDSTYLMGTQELYEDALEYIENHKFEADYEVRVPHLVSNVLGGLLSAYELTNKETLIEKATELGEVLIEVYKYRFEGLPYSHYNFATNSGTLSQNTLATADVLALSEFYRLHSITGDQRYLDLVTKVSKFIKGEIGRSPILLSRISTLEAGRTQPKTLGDTSFHPSNAPILHNLFNAWLMSGRNNTDLWDVYEKSKSFMLANLTLTARGGSVFVAERFGNGTLTYRMHHSGCSWAGLLARESLLLGYNSSEMLIAKQLAETCLNMYLESPVKLAPEYAYFTSEGMRLSDQHGAYRLSADTIESLFHLYRVTHDNTYKTAALFIFNQIKQQCKTKLGYAGLRNVMDFQPEHIDMPSYFLAKTLKYLYLIFSPDSFLQSKEYLITPQGHVLKIPS